MGSWVKINGMHQPLRNVENLPERFQLAVGVHLLGDSRGRLSSYAEVVHDQPSPMGVAGRSAGVCDPIQGDILYG